MSRRFPCSGAWNGFVVLASFVVFVLVEVDVRADSILAGSRIGATWRASKTYRNLWARRSDGHLVRLSLGSDTDDEAIWADQMSLGTPPNVNTRGIDSLSFTNSVGGEEEHAVYVGSDNRIYDWRLINSAVQVGPYLSVSAPSGETLTGHIAIGRRLDKVYYFVSTMSGKLWRYQVDNWNTGTFSRAALSASGVSTTGMISATGPFGGAYVRVFYSKTDNTVWNYKYDGANWTSTNFQGPDAPGAPNPADRPARYCDLLSATEGQTGLSGGYRTYVFCTRTGGTPHKDTLYFRVASGSGSQVFGAWGTRTVPLGAVATTGFGLSTRSRAEAGNFTLEAFLLGATLSNNLFHIEHTATQANLGSLTNMGWDGETSSRQGGVVAAGDETRGYSDAYFVGQADDSSWLYRKIQDNNGDFHPELWVNYGASDGWKIYEPGNGPPSPTESSTAILGGRVVIAATYSTPMAGQSATTKVLFSDDEGETFTGPTTVLSPTPLPYWLNDPPGPPAPSWGSGFDPVADFDDSGKAYIIELRNADQSDGSDGGRAVVLWSTTNGTLSFERQVFGSTGRADHPWIAIYRDPNGEDQIHMAWQMEEEGRILYTHAGVTDLEDLTTNVVELETEGIDIGLSRVTVSQFDGSVYVAWSHGICRAEPDGNCSGLLGYGEDLTPDNATSSSGSELQFPHTENTIRCPRCFSVVADPRAGHIVYYAFQKREPGVEEGHGPMDIYVSRLAYNEFTGDFDPGLRIALNLFEDDEIHQTLPELTYAEDGPGNRMILATWYDWNNVTCTIDGMVYDGLSWASSACYKVFMARSTDLGISWETIPHVFPTVSDPALLPQRRSVVGFESERFLGDYHSVTGDVLHSVHVAITAPVDGADQVTNIERGWLSHGYWNATE